MKFLISIIFVTISINVFGQACEEITMSFDKFTDITSFSSPNLNTEKPKYKDLKMVGLSFVKRVSDVDTVYLLSLTGMTAKLSIGSEGVIIILDNNQKINKRDVNFHLVQSTSVADLYIANMILTDEMVNLLIKHKITAIRLFAYDSLSHDDFDLKNEMSSALNFHLKCLLDK